MVIIMKSLVLEVSFKFAAIGERMTKELKALVPSTMKIKVVAPQKFECAGVFQAYCTYTSRMLAGLLSAVPTWIKISTALPPGC